MTIEKQSSCNNPFEEGAISVAEAVQKILQSTTPVADFTRLPLRDCLNRTLFEDINSPMDVPAHDNSAMDGYALNSKDLPQEELKTFRVIGTAYAGRPFGSIIAGDECVRIMTGAILPPNTDTIVIQEEVNVLDQDLVEIGNDNRKNQNVRFAGEDIKQGTAVLSRGHVVKAADLGVLASLGIAECKVFRKPRVCFFSTGDELKSIGETLNKGDIYDSNRYSLYGLLAECQVDIIDMGVVKDDPEAIRQVLLSAASCADVILTSGGVSVGEADYIKGILQDIGSMDFWKILMKPGRPLTFGKINETLFIGLPGNPVAVMVTFLQFVIPALKKLAGKQVKQVMSFDAVSASNIRKSPGRREFQRAIARIDENGQLEVALTGKQGSGILTSMKLANCFIDLAEQDASVVAGDSVKITFFDDFFKAH